MAETIHHMEFTPNNLTVRTFIHTFLINETRMVGENSILKNGQGYTKNIPISTITSLIYLATGNTFLKDGFTPETKGTVLRGKRAAARRFKYMISHEENRQTIILENEIPNIDYSGVHMIHSTKKEGDEMYGPIKGYRD
ncbi:hypothetical protein [Lachnoclostridium sp. An196]|uniref:hypothetical protein n=1 Tax=Lachnoclostridium sp. An196 TaxID=1965583 RepID=UPI00117A3A4A|nr:hypothetical protein [Lachnoclostridium sp. An196]